MSLIWLGLCHPRNRPSFKSGEKVHKRFRVRRESGGNRAWRPVGESGRHRLREGVGAGNDTKGQSDALVNQSGEERRGYDELTPLCIERFGRLGGNRLVERPALLVELRNVAAG